LNSTQAIISATNKVEKNSAHPWDAEDIKERLLLEKTKAQVASCFIERVLKNSTMAYSSSQTIKNHNV